MADRVQKQDVVAVIEAQHREIRRLLDATVAGVGSDRIECFDAVVRLLAVHETAEEMVVYPELRGAGPDGARIAEDRTHEEGVAKKTLADLEDLDRFGPEFERKVVDFRRDVDRHTNNEESDVLPLLRETSSARRKQMAQTFLLAEKLAPTHAHRTAPESALGNMLVGPFVGMVDKVRDAIARGRP